ncbi:MAG TPA: ABC transporter permease [candidate division Zixibacteria bacterium]|nr:ABC transporter permease [candidate division Zixibacteria bacterium]
MSQTDVSYGHLIPMRTSRKPRLSQGLYTVVGLAGGFILLVLIVFALFPEKIAPFDPSETVARPFLPPSGEHPLGTNDIGQDLFSELIWGARVSLLTGVLVGLVAVTIGSIVGLFAGYYDNIGSTFLMRVVDLTLALPFLPLVILIGAYLGPSFRNIIIILILVSWAAPARLIRSRVLETTSQPYVEAAIATGSSDNRTIVKHIWPAARIIALVQVVMVSAAAILAEASLSFLGLGDPSAKSWGTMLYFAQASGAFLGDAWKWWVVPTGIMISLTVLGLVLVGYALEQYMEPSLRRR